MKYFDWNESKNTKLKKERGISFEIIVSQIEQDKILDIIENPNKKKYKNQEIFIIEYENYAYLIPFSEDEKKIFLKTIIPSRKATKKYLNYG
ncbi:MAG TPA: toxin [Ignavibacteria bacterium]|nr:toxin [Ignavibacteria bacterium]